MLRNLILRQLGRDDAVALMLKGHIYVESELRALLATMVKEPVFVDALPLKYRGMLEVAVRVGVMSKATSKAFFALDHLRNLIAHDAERDIVRADVLHIFETLTAEVKEPFVEELYPTDRDDDFRELLRMTIVAMLLFLARTAAACAKDSVRAELIGRNRSTV
jgi:hypothetical protein